MCKRSTEAKDQALHNFHQNNHQIQSPKVNQAIKNRINVKGPKHQIQANTKQCLELHILATRHDSGRAAGKPVAAQLLSKL
jgi:hypothetical protein